MSLLPPKSKDPKGDDSSGGASDAAPAVRKKLKVDKRRSYQYFDDVDGDVCIDVVKEGNMNCLFVCTRKAVSLKAGEEWSPQTKIRARLSRGLGQIVSGISGREDLAISCSNHMGNNPLLKIQVHANRGDVELPVGTRIAEIYVVRTQRVQNFEFRHICEVEEHVSAVARNESGSDTADAIAMPIVNCPQVHRPKMMIHHVYSACVARPVTKKEAKSNAQSYGCS